jgi:DNA polymerase-3 subunit beta
MHAISSGSDLSAALACILPATDARSTIPALALVRLTTQQDALELSACNAELQITTRIPSLAKRPGSIAIPAKLAYQQVGPMTGGDVDISVDARLKALIAHSGTKARLNGVEAEEVIGIEGEETDEIVLAGAMNSADLLFLLRCVGYCCTDNAGKFALPAVSLALGEGTAHAEALDGDARLSFANAPASVSTPGSILIPRKALAALPKLLAGSDTVAIEASNRFASFKAGQAELRARLTQGKFPDFSRVMPDVTTRGKAVFNTKRLIGALQCAVPFALDGDITAKVKMRFEDGICVSSSGFNSGDLEATVPAEGGYSPVEVFINAAFVLDFLRSHDEEFSTAYVPKASNHPVELRPGAGESDAYRALIMTMHG